MLLVKTKVKPSSIDGLGLYAAESIRFGEIVEIVETDFSYKVFTQEQVNKFDELKRQYEHDYTFKIGSNYYATIDMAKFMNHSSTPNLFWRETIELKQNLM
jgi:SET domain-containing protein